MEHIFETLLQEVSLVHKEHGTLTNEILSVLNGVVPGPLQPALDLVDQHAVSRLQSPSGRALYQVMGSSGTPYTCFSQCDYCSCPAYRFAVLTRGDAVLCKHLLAIRLCVAIDQLKVQEITNDDLANILRTMD